MVNNIFLCNITIYPTNRSTPNLISYNGTSQTEYNSVGNNYSLNFNLATPGIYVITVTIKNTNLTNSTFFQIIAGKLNLFYIYQPDGFYNFKSDIIES